jgi:hypothetical protein
MPNQFGVDSVDCVNGLMTVKYSDNGNCKVPVAQSAGFGLDGTIPIPNITGTGLPGQWYTLFGDLNKVGLSKFGDFFSNITGEDICVKVTLQYGWRPFSTAGTSRLMYIMRFTGTNSTTGEIVMGNYAASNNTDVVQSASNIIVLKKNQSFQPFAWQNSGALAYLGQAGLDTSTNIIIPETTITIERIFDFV